MSRPAGVTVVAVIVWITGLLQVIGGLLTILIPFVGIISIILGIITIVVGSGLLGGSNVARVLTTIVLALNLASAVFSITGGSNASWSSIISGILALIGIVLLYTRAANAYFRR